MRLCPYRAVPCCAPLTCDGAFRGTNMGCARVRLCTSRHCLKRCHFLCPPMWEGLCNCVSDLLSVPSVLATPYCAAFSTLHVNTIRAGE